MHTFRAQLCGLDDDHVEALISGRLALRTVNLKANPQITVQAQQMFIEAQEKLGGRFKLVAETLDWVTLLALLAAEAAEEPDFIARFPWLMELSRLGNASKKIDEWVAGSGLLTLRENVQALGTGDKNCVCTLNDSPVDPVDGGNPAYQGKGDAYDRIEIENPEVDGEAQYEVSIWMRRSEIGRFMKEHLSDQRLLFRLLFHLSRAQGKGEATLDLEFNLEESSWSGAHIEQLRRADIHLKTLSINIQDRVSFTPFEDQDLGPGSERYANSSGTSQIERLRIVGARDKYLEAFSNMVIRQLEVDENYISSKGWRQFADVQDGQTHITTQHSCARTCALAKLYMQIWVRT